MPNSVQTTLTPKWLAEPEVQRIFTALGAPEIDARAVGGAVRDAVMGRDRGDSEIDLATPEEPDEVIARLQNANLRVVPTGLSHGTVTAVVGKRTFEITSLRRDTATDGRHAVVEFTEDWHEDARRRDFTFNAMSMERDGTVHDDHGGMEDAKAGRVRFVGATADRIQEDYLRVLRLFRFQALYGRTPIDADILSACRAHAAGLARLSAERVQAELAKMLGAPSPYQAVAQMQEAGVLDRVLPVRDGGAQFARLEGVEHAAHVADAAWLRRLAALVDGADARAVADALKLSNADRAALVQLTMDQSITPDLPPAALRRALYDLETAVVRNRALLAWTRAPYPRGMERWQALLKTIADWVPTSLPLSGGDVLALGVAPGPRVGTLLEELLTWWLAREPAPDRAAALAELQSRVSKR